MTADTCVARKTDHPLGQSMATEQKVQHVDGRDVGLDLNPLVRSLRIVQWVYLEASSYSFYVAGYLSSTVVKSAGYGSGGIQEGCADHASSKETLGRWKLGR